MAGDAGKKVSGDEGSSEHIEGELLRADSTIPAKEGYVVLESMPSVDLINFPRAPVGPMYDYVSEEETEVAFVYKMDKTWLKADEVRVEIRWGHELRLIGRGDEPIKVELPRNNEMRVREATASLSPDGVLTVVIPKRQRPWKWFEFMDLVFLWFKTVHVGISS